MKPAPSSSLRVSPATRKRAKSLASRLHLASQQEVINRALTELENRLFWEGFDEEAREYRESYAAGEERERRAFAGTSGDGRKAKK